MDTNKVKSWSDDVKIQDGIMPDRICGGCQYYDECFNQPPHIKECKQYRGRYSKLVARYLNDNE